MGIDVEPTPGGGSHAGDRALTSAPPPEPADTSRSLAPRHQREVRAAETRLLYENASTGTAVTIVIAALLAYAQWNVVPRPTMLAWLSYMFLVAVARSVLVRRYRRASPNDTEIEQWNAAFVAGSAIAAAGWGAGAVVLYSRATPLNEVLVVFAVGGVMLGGASLLAARPEAFLTFLVPTGLITSLRLASEGDEQHLMMGFLAAVFTAATVLTTWRFHLAIESALGLRVANQHLIESLESARDDARALNRELELRVQDRTARLTEADRLKDEFLATLAHELRNPLAPIRFALDALKDTPPEVATRARDVIERQVAQLVRLVDDLLDVSRITAHKIQLRREALDVARLMATAAESAMPLATASGQTLELQLPSPPVSVHADGARLVQVLANVLNNAVKFTPPGGHIRFAATRQSDEVVVRVSDTGLGIAPDVLPRVFDMFHQAGAPLDRSAGGLGIGLTLARRLVEMHDGRIDVRSAGTGQGTEVEIRLPVAAAPLPAAAPKTLSAAATRRLRVLIVEDNPDAAEMLALAVSRLGHLSQVAHDGATAVAMARTSAPDVLLLDIGLPGMSGYDVARTLRQDPGFSHVHIAAVSGWGQEEDRRQARGAGCDSHFTKPLAPATVEELLVSIAGRVQNGRPASDAPRTRLADSSGTV